MTLYSKTVFLAIAFGTSVRDVLRNDTYRILKGQKNLKIVIFAQDIGPEFQAEFGGENIEFEKLTPFRPTIRERVLLQFHRACLRDRCRTIDLGNTAGDTSSIDRFTPLARMLLKFFGSARVNKMISWLYRIVAARNSYREAFKKYNPDLVVVTRVLNYSADYPIMRSAQANKVPVVSLVSSWDNLTSKAFFPFALERLFVWNHVLENEAVDLFDFPKKLITVTGIPRYDLFFQRAGFGSKSSFFEKFDLSKSLRLITYATGSETTGRSKLDPVTPEPNIAAFIATSIEKGDIPNAQLIVRLHPQANPEHYKELFNRTNVLVQIPGKKGAFQDRIFSDADDVEFGETMLHSDVVVNFASTVTIDAAVFDTPVVCVNFDFNGERPYSQSPTRFYEFDHYAKLLEMGGVQLAGSREELVDSINSAMDSNQLQQEGRRRIVSQQCVFTDGKSGERVAKGILEGCLGVPASVNNDE